MRAIDELVMLCSLIWAHIYEFTATFLKLHTFDVCSFLHRHYTVKKKVKTVYDAPELTTTWLTR